MAAPSISRGIHIDGWSDVPADVAVDEALTAIRRGLHGSQPPTRLRSPQNVPRRHGRANRLAGKVCIITGAGGSMGRRIAETAKKTARIGKAAPRRGPRT